MTVLFFRFPLFCNVCMCADHAKRSAIIGTRYNFSTALYPAVFAIFSSKAVAIFVSGMCAVEVCLKIVNELCLVIRMNSVFPFLNAVQDLIFVKTKQSSPGRREIKCAGSNIPVPDTMVAGFQ